ncbi:hypothetical protein GCM10022260_25220 [Gaetbulibacter aestuarii]
MSTVISCVEAENKNSILGIIYFDDKNASNSDYERLGNIEDLSSILKKYKKVYGIIAAFENQKRKMIYENIISLVPEFNFKTVIHPSVILGREVSIGKGSFLMANCIINSNVTLGEFCFLSGNLSVGHDCIINNFVDIEMNVTVGGYVQIGDFSKVEMSSKIIQNTKIGNLCGILANSLVTKDVKDYFTVYGTPAKIIKTQE